MPQNQLHVIRLNTVKAVTGLSRSTIYALIKAGKFPKQIQLTSARCVGWLESDVMEFITSRINASNIQ